jgi:predicted HicB family RNase H-like nuclease
MRRILDGTAYDTETGELIKQIWYSPDQEETTILHRTRHGAFFFYHRYLQKYFDPYGGGEGYDMKEQLIPCTVEDAQKWLEKCGNELVEQYFGEMPEGGAAERRLTLRMPNNLARRLEALAKAQETPLNRYINRCLERCAAEDGKPATVE